jgi:hypothetical protein
VYVDHVVSVVAHVYPDAVADLRDTQVNPFGVALGSESLQRCACISQCLLGCRCVMLVEIPARQLCTQPGLPTPEHHHDV